MYLAMHLIMIYTSLDVMEGNKQMFLCISAGRKIAIDASMCIYQFLIAVRQDGNVLQNEDGETTRYSHSKTDTFTSVKMLLLVQ